VPLPFMPPNGTDGAGTLAPPLTRTMPALICAAARWAVEMSPV
jgi:hypothetical protein